MSATLRPAISLAEIVKRFDTVTALERASLVVQTGTVHALLGENGAGKTTLMRIAFGMIHPDAGHVEVDGQRAQWRSPRDAIRAGVGMVHQHFTLVPAMTVAENVELGVTDKRRWRFDRQFAEERVHALGRESGLSIRADARVSDLSIAAQQRVEILKALSRSARILILDEPTAVLAPRETEELLTWLREYANRGSTVILITHKLREALAVADEVTVLRRGQTVLATARSATDATSLTRAMIGDQIDADIESELGARTSVRPAVDHDRATSRAPLVVLDGVVARDDERREVVHASFAVYAHEIVGVAGVEGAGQHTLLRVLAGRIRPTAGRLTTPPEVAFIPEDRHRDALVLDFTLAENVAIRGAGKRRGLMSWAAVRKQTAVLMQQLDIRAPGPSTRARVLSGGNQQRLVLARELDGRPPVVVAENPTRGLDVRAAADIHERLRAAQRAGSAVVLYSSDLDEVLALATRVIAVHAGSTREVAPEKDLVGRAILGLQ